MTPANAALDECMIGVKNQRERLKKLKTIIDNHQFQVCKVVTNN